MKRQKPSLAIGIILVVVLLVQQSAFIEMPALVGRSLEQDANVLNTIAIALSFILMSVLLFSDIQNIGYLASKNAVAVLYTALTIISIAWSIHPDLTIRRSLGYLLSISIAAFLVVRFKNIERMKLISASFAVSAVASVLYVAMSPEDGIMNAPTLVGAWRGVFTHKNVMGPIMSVAVFTELYIIVSFEGSSSRWRFALLLLYLGLVFLSHSVTAIASSVGYIIVTCVFVMWKRYQLVGTVVGAIVMLLASLGLFVFLFEPEYVLDLFGKDAGLTGRTQLWEIVLNLVRDRPVLGYGYRSMWADFDTYRKVVDQQTGGWGVVHAQNALLEITLELGIVGALIMLIYLGSAMRRAVLCCAKGKRDHGVFSLMFIIVTILAGLTEMNIGWNQSLSWLLFNVLYFSCLEIIDSKTVASEGPSNVRYRLVNQLVD
jgi:exopolysaccharide production protein ExoQ